jgi:hypothetical protein
LSTETTTRTGGVLAATCLSTLVVNANTSAVSILLPAISEGQPLNTEVREDRLEGLHDAGDERELLSRHHPADRQGRQDEDQQHQCRSEEDRPWELLAGWIPRATQSYTKI